jgi:4-aminobutyrate aminotransferase / (S)-3-amino-2-methylpropionate transaminase / 5-aminovalerate transaminase
VADVTRIETRYRRIVTEIPNPASRPILDELACLEPRSMAGFSEVVWQRAEGCQVWDAAGNMWLDFTSGIILANAGHANLAISQAIRRQVDSQLLFHYCNPSAVRLNALQALRSILPGYLDKAFLLSTGGEAVEAAIKLIRTHGRSLNPTKTHIVSYLNAFHGRTMGAQMVGGFLDQQEWMGDRPPGFHHIPYPDCALCPWGKSEYHQCGEECLRRSLEMLRKQGLADDLVAGVITETFPGPTVAFMPLDYVRALREWTSQHKALLVFDEIQAGFGRTGKWFGFEHYDVEPDLICLGKGTTSSLPLSAVAGRAAIMDLPPHGDMSSTHTGNPVCCAAMTANIQVLREAGMVANAAMLGSVVQAALTELRDRLPDHVGAINGHGLAWGVYVLDPAVHRLNPGLATAVIQRCQQLGLLLLPTGGRGTLKIAPPLCITEDALCEGLAVIEQALAECVAQRLGVLAS